MRTPMAAAACGAMIMALGACAGRPPHPVAVVQPQDHYSDCLAIAAEVRGNNQKVQELGSEEGAKVGQNVAAGVAGLFIWPLWFAMDFQGAAGKEVAALQTRQQYLGTLADQRRCGEAAPATARGLVSPAPAALYAPQPAPATIPIVASAPAYPPSPATTAIASPATDGQTVLVPLMINEPYHPHWTVGGSH
jgi:hypothetical protein